MQLLQALPLHGSQLAPAPPPLHQQHQQAGVGPFAATYTPINNLLQQPAAFQMQQFAQFPMQQQQQQPQQLQQHQQHQQQQLQMLQTCMQLQVNNISPASPTKFGQANAPTPAQQHIYTTSASTQATCGTHLALIPAAAAAAMFAAHSATLPTSTTPSNVNNNINLSATTTTIYSPTKTVFTTTATTATVNATYTAVPHPNILSISGGIESMNSVSVVSSCASSECSLSSSSISSMHYLSSPKKFSGIDIENFLKSPRNELNCF